MGQSAPYKVFVHPPVFDDYSNKAVREDMKHKNVKGGRWPHATIPYVIKDNSNKQFAAIMTEAIDEFNTKTSINWIKKQQQHFNYIEFKYTPGCFEVRCGCYFNGNQSTLINTLSKTKILRYMMKCLGFQLYWSSRDEDPYISRTNGDNKSIMNEEMKCDELTEGDIYAINMLYSDMIETNKMEMPIEEEYLETNSTSDTENITVSPQPIKQKTNHFEVQLHGYKEATSDPPTMLVAKSASDNNDINY